MPLPSDLEGFRQIFEDRRTYLAVGKIEKLELNSDRSVLWAYCNILTQERTIVARVTWDAIGPDSGIFQFPVVGDLVLVGWAEGDDEQAFVIRAISSKVDKIPTQATTGDTVMRALSGKKVQVITDKDVWILAQENIKSKADLINRVIGGTKVYLAKTETAPTENLVLGQVLKTLLADILTELKTLSDNLATHTHTSGPPGVQTAPPTQAAVFTASGVVFNAKKANPVNNENILSDLAFTEKG